MTPSGPVAALIPVKAFGEAKRRLAPALDVRARARLARAMAATVVGAAAPLDVLVVCDDPEVRRWATDLGADVLLCPERGLNRAVADGIAHLAAAEVTTAIVAHADLPYAANLAAVAEFDGVTLVPDRAEDGTNVVALPTACGFRFAYGPGSFRRHLAEAQRLGLPVRVLHEPRLSWDVDVPADLEVPLWA
ncbi:MAG: 2-phospho-L-lactate guanylyltransferase [Acidimicrobiia bacterium]|nr:2-phospho-L-lactate guanylyltransferase [Acidimicrobiia bacterium]